MLQKSVLPSVPSDPLLLVHFFCWFKWFLVTSVLDVFNFCFIILRSLDTFPYAGTTTTCESLYMGVPCVTMAGSVHAHNVGVSLLSKVGKELLFFLSISIMYLLLSPY